MNDILKEFKVVFGLDNTNFEKGLKQSESSLMKFGKVFGGIAASFASFQLFKGIVTDFVSFNTELKNNIDHLGLSAEKTTALGNALKRFGGDTNSVISSIQSLANHLEAAKQGGGALVEASKKFGIGFSPFASAESTLESLVKQMKNYSAQQRVAIAQSLSLDKSLVLAFKDGGSELENLIKKQKELGTTTQRDLEISKNFNNAFLNLKDIFAALMRDFSRVILPSFTKLVKLFGDFIMFLRNHKTLVVGFFAALLVALTPILLTFGKMAIASVAAFAPIYAIIAVITAIAAILEDIYYYFMGWESVTGKLVDKFPALASVLEVIQPIVVGIFDTFNNIIDFIKDPSWDSFLNIFKGLGDVVKNTINAAFDFLLKIVDKLSKKFNLLAPILKPLKEMILFIKDTFAQLFDMLASFNFDSLVNGIKGLGDNIKDSIGGFFDSINPFSSGKQAELTPALQATPQMPSNAYNTQNANTYNINQNINQNIATATPKALADSTNKAMIDSVNQMRQQRGDL